MIMSPSTAVATIAFTVLFVGFLELMDLLSLYCDGPAEEVEA